MPGRERRARAAIAGVDAHGAAVGPAIVWRTAKARPKSDRDMAPDKDAAVAAVERLEARPISGALGLVARRSPSPMQITGPGGQAGSKQPGGNAGDAADGSPAQHRFGA